MEKVFWHLTTDPDWKLKRDYHPIYAYGFGQPASKPGIFVTDQPIYWCPWMGKGPIYAARISVPEEAVPPPSTSHPEYLITDLEHVRVLEVLPLAEVIKRGEEEQRRGINWWNQEYGGFGSVVDWWFYYDRNKDKKYQRKGLDELKKKWLEEHPGYKDPDEYYREKYK
jgi:hypothetical protein